MSAATSELFHTHRDENNAHAHACLRELVHPTLVLRCAAFIIAVISSLLNAFLFSLAAAIQLWRGV